MAQRALLGPALQAVGRRVDAGRARWLDVKTGLRSDGGVEISSPPLEAGRTVVVSGQVGLAEGTPVAAAP